MIDRCAMVYHQEQPNGCHTARKSRSNIVGQVKLHGFNNRFVLRYTSLDSNGNVYTVYT